MSSNLLSGYAVTAVILQQLLTADMIVFRPWTNCPWIVRSGDNLSVETTMETTMLFTTPMPTDSSSDSFELDEITLAQI